LLRSLTLETIRRRRAVVEHEVDQVYQISYIDLVNHDSRIYGRFCVGNYAERLLRRYDGAITAPSPK